LNLSGVQSLGRRDLRPVIEAAVEQFREIAADLGAEAMKRPHKRIERAVNLLCLFLDMGELCVGRAVIIIFSADF
jgi:hypothetical protein